MSENLNIRATFTASDDLSPVLRKIISDVKRLESAAKRLAQSFSGVGRAGTQAFTSFDRVAQNASAQMRGLGSTAKQVSRSYADDWRRATDRRLSDARRMYVQLERLESQYQRQLSRRVAAERSAGRVGVGSTGRIPAPRISTLMFGAAAIGASTASAIKKRIEVEAAETRAAMFGELSKADILSLRKDTDKLGIRYGVGSTKAIDAATEGLKAGIEKQFAGQFAELALKARAGLDINEADTAKLMGRLTTMRGGFDYASLSSILNAIAVANNATAADGNEIVEAYRRSLSALTATKMKPEDLAAFNASAVSIGIQPFKAGTYMSFITSELANAKNARGQRKEDMTKASHMLGFGGLPELSAQMTANPTETLLKVYERIMQLPEGLRSKVATLIGQREWRDELLSVAAARDLIVKTLSEIANKRGFLDSSSLQKIKSMGGRWATIQAALSLAWEKVGGGFETLFDQISDALISIANKFNFDTIKDHFAASINGAREGFSLGDWGEVVRSVADSFDAGSLKQWREFGKGFAEGAKEFFSALKVAFSGVALAFGRNPNSAKDMGNLVAKLIGLVTALALLAPLLNVLGSFASIITGLALSISIGGSGVAVGLGGLGLVATLKAFGVNVKDLFVNAITAMVPPIGLAIKGGFNMIGDWMLDAVKGLAGRVWNWFGGSGPSGSRGGASGSWSTPGASGSWSPTSYKAARSFNGMVQRASFMTDVPSFNGSGGSAGGLDRAAFERKFANTALAGKYDAIVAEAKANGISPSLLAGVIAHETGNGLVLSGNNPGGIMDPAAGMARKMRFADLDSGINKTAQTVAKNYRAAGGDLGKMGSRYAPVGAANDPLGLNGGWPAGVRRQMNQLSGGAGGVDISGIKGGANFMRGQFGPAGSNLTTITLDSGKRVTVHKEAAESFRGFLNELEGGGYKIKSLGGFNYRNIHGGSGLSQHAFGNAIDVNGFIGNGFGKGASTDLPSNVRDMAAKYGLSWGGDWKRRPDPMHFEWMGKRPWLNVPTPADMVRSIPPAAVPGVGAGDVRMAPGPIVININGGSNDPEALATLVQRRIDESMMWRTHDTEYEYT